MSTELRFGDLGQRESGRSMIGSSRVPRPFTEPSPRHPVPKLVRVEEDPLGVRFAEDALDFGVLALLHRFENQLRKTYIEHTARPVSGRRGLSPALP